MFGCCCWFGYSELSGERGEDGDYAIILDGREEFFIRMVMAQREIPLLDIGTGNRERWKRGRRTKISMDFEGASPSLQIELRLCSRVASA